jgi:hypothetical protein
MRRALLFKYLSFTIKLDSFTHLYIQGVPELADQIYCAFSLVITESNSVLKKGQGITDFL